MSKYSIGVDVAKGSDYSAYIVVKHQKIRWYHFWLKRLHLIKYLPAPYRVIDHWLDNGDSK